MKAVESFRCNSGITGCGNFFFSSTYSRNSMNGVEVLDVVKDNLEPIDENAKYSVYDVANWFLLKGNMTHKKLQKLCYYAQAWCYALKNYRLVDSDFQAWVHGPVSPALYERFRDFGYEVIHAYVSQKVFFDEEDEALLNDVWDTYGDKTGNALEMLSHTEYPWIEARRGYSANERCNVIISPESMRKYYNSIYQQ
ncbi:MAG: DUF4065 domain-containing protein [Eubacteriales bacterium]|nr:DUF4065 domain-containing protein [Eubacteriales bacterium]